MPPRKPEGVIPDLLTDLKDVDDTVTLQDGFTIAWDATRKMWVPAAGGGGGGGGGGMGWRQVDTSDAAWDVAGATGAWTVVDGLFTLTDGSGGQFVALSEVVVAAGYAMEFEILMPAGKTVYVTCNDMLTGPGGGGSAYQGVILDPSSGCGVQGYGSGPPPTTGIDLTTDFTPVKFVSAGGALVAEVGGTPLQMLASAGSGTVVGNPGVDAGAVTMGLYNLGAGNEVQFRNVKLWALDTLAMPA